MNVRRTLALVILTFAAFAVPRAARAQLAVAPFVGREFDEASNWVLFGVEARYGLSSSAWSLNPRFTYHPLTGGNIIQLDANLVYDFKPASGPVTPYAGAGVGWTHISGGGESDSKAVANFVSGLRLHLAGNDKIEPYVNAQYSFAKQFTNTYQLVAGLQFSMK